MPIQFLVNGLITGCLYALIALGFGLIYATTKVFHFAHAAVYVLSVYIFYTLFSLWAVPLILSFVLTVVLISVIGIVIDELIYIPLRRRNASSLIYLLSSLALYIVIVNFIAMLYGNETKVITPGLQPTYSFWGVILTQIQIFAFFAFIIIFTAFTILLRRTSLGMKVRAMRDNPDLVSTLGINPRSIRRFVFAAGSAMAAVAAVLQGLDVGMDPLIGMPALLNGAVAVIIGGIGIFEGAALGALLLGTVQSLVVWQMSARWQDLITFLVLILFLLLRPEGILGIRRRVEEAFQ